MNITADAGKSLAKKQKKTTCLWLGPYPLIFVNDPEDIYVSATGSMVPRLPTFRIQTVHLLFLIHLILYTNLNQSNI